MRFPIALTVGMLCVHQFGSCSTLVLCVRKSCFVYVWILFGLHCAILPPTEVVECKFLFGVCVCALKIFFSLSVLLLERPATNVSKFVSFRPQLVRTS